MRSARKTQPVGALVAGATSEDQARRSLGASGRGFLGVHPGSWPAACPVCVLPLATDPTGEQEHRKALYCPDHGAFTQSDGIWRFLTADQAERYARFSLEYQAVRRAEGRGIADAAYYRALPFQDRSGRFTEQWRIRAAGYRALVTRVLEVMERERTRPLDILDLGSGNGWLSHRLAERGHHPAAVDLGDDALDGLGARVWYAEEGSAPFISIQTDFDRLPLADGCADLVVFNASLHYSPDIATTIAEALRVLRPDGRLVILDSPVYRAAENGERMVREREDSFRRQYGFPSNAIASENYLTSERLDEVAAGLGLSWQVFLPWRGMRWALRPWIARARGQRERSSFWLIVGARTHPDRAGQGGPAAPSRRTGALPAAWRVLLRLRYKLIECARQKGPVWETVAARTIVVQPGVFNPRLFRTGEHLAHFVARGGIARGATVLDLGTGSGAGALAAAGLACRVVAVDLNPVAVECAAANARLNDLAERIEARLGDLFDGLDAAERFDLVLFNPPFYRGEPRDATDAAWRSVDVPERFAEGLAGHLTPRGRALVVLSSDCDVDGWFRPCREQGLDVRLVSRRNLINEVLLLYRIAPPSTSRGRSR